MCDPRTSAEIALTSEATGALLSAVGTFSNASSQKAAALANADYATQQAADARNRGVREAERHGREVSQLKGRQRASLAARGVVLTEGSPLAILDSTDELARIDARNIAENAKRESEGYDAEAASYRAEAASKNPFLSGASSLLTGASSVADRWAIYKQKGINPFSRKSS